MVAWSAPSALKSASDHHARQPIRRRGLVALRFSEPRSRGRRALRATTGFAGLRKPSARLSQLGHQRAFRADVVPRSAGARRLQIGELSPACRAIKQRWEAQVSSRTSEGHCSVCYPAFVRMRTQPARARCRTTISSPPPFQTSRLDRDDREIVADQPCPNSAAVTADRSWPARNPRRLFLALPRSASNDFPSSATTRREPVAQLPHRSRVAKRVPTEELAGIPNSTAPREAGRRVRTIDRCRDRSQLEAEIPRRVPDPIGISALAARALESDHGRVRPIIARA